MAYVPLPSVLPVRYWQISDRLILYYGVEALTWHGIVAGEGDIDEVFWEIGGPAS